MSTGPYDTSSQGMHPPQKPGMSSGAKVLLILGIVFGCLFLLCCGGLFLTGWWMKSKISDDPAVVARVSDEIVRIDVPDGLDPAFSMDMKIPLTDQEFKVVVHADPDRESALVLVAVGGEMAEKDQREIRRSIEQSLRQQAIEGQEDIVIQESDDKRLDINGQPVTFKISKGVGRESRTPRIEVTGVFQGKNSPVMLMFNGEAEKYTEERLVRMLESIEGAKAPRAPEEPPKIPEKEPAEEAATKPGPAGK